MAITDQMLDELLKDYQKPEDLLGRNGLLKQLQKRLLEKALGAELTVHLGYGKHAAAGDNTGNSRNGTSPKTIKGEFGNLELAMTRDRNGSFEPQIVAKGQRRFEGFDQAIISLYSRGLTTREIEGHLLEIYGVELAPGDLQRVLFAPSGAVAVSIALQLARAATGRHKTISMWDSFHGATLDAISVGGEAFFRRGNGPLLPGGEHVPPADPRHCPFACGTACNLKCADYIEYILDKEGDVAAVIGETIRSAPFIPPPDYWKRIRAACDRHGAMLILDEIPHCLGRTGRMFTCEHYDVVPDILVLGKGLGGGIMPLAGMLAREHLNVTGDRALGHFTHEKSPAAAAAALATLKFIEDEGLLARAQTLGEQTLRRLVAMKGRHPLIGDVRGLGLMLGIELTRDRATMQRATDEAECVMYACLEAGLSFKVTMGNILTLTPPLTITDAEMDDALAILEKAISEVEAKNAPAST